MADSLAAPLAGVALAAGAGVRLRPLTLERPKPLCPVGDRTLLDRAVDALAAAVEEVAVNCHHLAEQIHEHVESRAGEVSFVSDEPVALGTAGAIGRLRPWLDGRAALVVNADTYHRADLAEFVAGWDGERIRLLTPTKGPFGPTSGVVASILPWEVCAGLEAEPSGLWERVWRAAVADDRIDTQHHREVVVDCASPTEYLMANLMESGGATVVEPGGRCDGDARRCVIWEGAVVRAGEQLVDAIRTPERTVLVR